MQHRLNGPNTGTDWTIEGRRAIPLLPRLKARSAFATLANSLSLATAAANKRNLPAHEKTEDAKGFKEIYFLFWEMCRFSQCNQLRSLIIVIVNVIIIIEQGKIDFTMSLLL